MRTIEFVMFMSIALPLTSNAAEKSVSDMGRDIVNGLKGFWNGAGQFFEGLGQSFGAVSSDYRYNYIVFNDSASPIFAGTQGITGVMGAKFSGDIHSPIILQPGENSKENFKAQQLYAVVWICGDKSAPSAYARSSSTGGKVGAGVGALGFGIGSPIVAAIGSIVGGVVTTSKMEAHKIFSRVIDLGKKNDPNWYYYRAFTYGGQVHGEYLGIKAQTNDFSGVFLNSTTNNDIFLRFVKDGVSYTINLESRSFNLLQSTVGVEGSIRPKTGQTAAFDFYRTANNLFNETTSLAHIPVADVGIANISFDPTTQKQSVAGPMTYTYEVYNTEKPTVGIQGLSVGQYDVTCLDVRVPPTTALQCNSDQPLSRVRDINPAECHIWRMSAKEVSQQAQGKPTLSIPFDSNASVWISYHTQDFSYQQKIAVGDVVDVGLIRPRLSEKQAVLYIASVHTTDDVKAKKFLDRLTAGTIGNQAVYTAVSADDIQKFIDGKKELLVDSQSNENGIINDSNPQDPQASGVRGELLVADFFAPRGVGNGPFYYILEPDILQLEPLVAGLYLADNAYNADHTVKDEIVRELQEKFVGWINKYPQDKEGVARSVTEYMQQRSNPALFSTDMGKRTVDALLTGPMSIANPPLVRQAGKNYYVYALGEAPSNWPKKK